MVFPFEGPLTIFEKDLVSSIFGEEGKIFHGSTVVNIITILLYFTDEHADYFLALKNLIEETYAVNGNQPVVLIVHSLGGLMTVTMLHETTQSWRDKYIRTVISLSGAWGGSAKAVKVFAIGESALYKIFSYLIASLYLFVFYYTGDNLGAIVLSGSVLRTEQISSPSLAWLLPSPHLWGQNEILVEAESKNYSLSNLQEFFKYVKPKFFSAFWKA